MRKLFSWLKDAADDRGQSMVETALMLPIMVFLVLAGGDMARGFAIQIAIQNGARAGAEAAAIDFTPTAAETEARARYEMSRTPGMESASPSDSVTYKQIDGANACMRPP